MAGKANEKIYDYFKSDPIILNGKFARYADDMWVQNRIDDRSKFEKLVDLYATAAIIGFRKGSRLADDKMSDDKRTIPLDVIAKGHYNRLYTIMQVILLLDNSRGLEAKEKARMAFDGGNKTEKDYTDNMELFHSYARGGLEHLHNVLVRRPVNPDDEFSDAKIANVMEFIKNPINNDEFL